MKSKSWIFEMKAKDFKSLTDLRNQILDYTDLNGYICNQIIMNKKQYKKYQSFFLCSINMIPNRTLSFRGAKIIVK